MFAFMAKKDQSFATCANCIVSFVSLFFLDAFNKTQSGEVAGNIFSFDEIFLCCNASCSCSVDRPDPAQFQKINFVG